MGNIVEDCFSDANTMSDIKLENYTLYILNPPFSPEYYEKILDFWNNQQENLIDSHLIIVGRNSDLIKVKSRFQANTEVFSKSSIEFVSNACRNIKGQDLNSYKTTISCFNKKAYIEQKNKEIKDLQVKIKMGPLKEETFKKFIIEIR